MHCSDIFHAGARMGLGQQTSVEDFLARHVGRIHMRLRTTGDDPGEDMCAQGASTSAHWVDVRHYFVNVEDNVALTMCSLRLGWVSVT